MLEKRTVVVFALVLLVNLGAFFFLKSVFLEEELVHGGTFPDLVGLEIESELDGTSTLTYQGRSVRVPSEEVMSCDLYREARSDFARIAAEGVPTTVGWHRVQKYQIALAMLSVVFLYRWIQLPRV